jgi:sulfoxide reductase heme-binding subunit YedZ
MIRASHLRRAITPTALAAALVPLVLLAWDAYAGRLGVNPIETLTHRTGFWALTFLAVTLAVSPLKRLTGFGALIRQRRLFGLAAFGYAALHFAVYVVDQTYLSGLGVSPAAIVEDVAERPYVTVGFTALVLLIPLAVTSTKGWVKRLGGRRWSRLHRLVYAVAVLAVLHFVWLVKADLREPLVFAGVIGVLLGERVVRALRRSAVPGLRPQGARGTAPRPDTL